LFAADFSRVLLNQRDSKLSDGSAELSSLPENDLFGRRAPSLSWRCEARRPGKPCRFFFANFSLPWRKPWHRLGFTPVTAYRFRGFLEHDSPMEDEHRVTNRQRVLKAGKIEFGGGAIDCTVRNISATGAALDVTSPVGIPAQFTLVTEGDHLPCRVVWRKEKRIGIAFDQKR
jgi:hypothetical protein